jgi:hypothetical protein
MPFDPPPAHVLQAPLINPDSRTLTVADFAPPTALEATFRVQIAPNGDLCAFMRPPTKTLPPSSQARFRR